MGRLVRRGIPGQGANQALRTALVAAALLALEAPLRAGADFVGGVESFDGTVLDTNTWIATELNGSVSQDDRLQLDSLGYAYVDYTTVSAKVGVGDVVSVELISLSTAVAALFLTTDSEGTAQTSLFDSATVSLWYNASLSWFEAANGDGSLHYGTLFGHGTPPPPEGSPYVLEIERNSSTSATYRAFEADGTPIGSVTRTFEGVPDELFISLITFSGSTTLASTAVFDDLEAPIPDPAAVPALSGPGTLLLAAAILLSFRSLGSRTR